MENSYPSQYLTNNQVRLHYKTAGPIDGDPVVLLHGFPEFWYGWRNQIPALAEAGHRVIIPDQRGYHLSDKPRGIRHYDLNTLAEDVISLIDALGHERVHLVGHDWGAVVAWWVAMHSPSRVNRLAILNGPHPSVMFQNLLHNPAQRRRSWYMFFFQLPFLPELLLRQNDHKRAARLLKSSSLSSSFSSEDLSQYRQAWSQPRAWTGMINWYRAIRRRVGGKIPADRVQVPVLIIWGEKDAAFEPAMVEQSLKFCPDGRLELVPRAAHWVQHDAADKVNGWLVDFFRQ